MDKYAGCSIDSLCRTCLGIIDDCKYDILLLPTLAKKLVVCTSLKVESDDVFPKNICESCYRKLNDLYDFHGMCLESVGKFQQILGLAILKEEQLVIESCTDEDLNEDIDNVLATTTKVESEMEENIDFLLKTELSGDEQQHSSSGTDGSDRDDPNVSFDEEDDDDADETPKQVRKKTKKQKRPAGKIYQCDKCPQRFFIETRYVAHQRFHEGLKPYVCQFCSKEFAKASGLGVHVRDIHSGNTEMHSCPEPGCERSYKRKQTLSWHIRTYHSAQTVDAASKVFICEDCGKTFKNYNSLKKHRYKHNGKELPFECEECHKRYMTNHKLKEHMMRHAGIKNFVCPHCGMRKTTRNELNVHINYHTKEKQYPCSFCDQIFNSTGNLSRHKRIVHEGIKVYPCKFCGRKFGKAETCKHHEMTHTGEKPHECPECGKRFIQLVAMRVHLKRHAKNGSMRKGRTAKELVDEEEDVVI